MITKLYNLNKSKQEQNIILKQKLLIQIKEINDKIISIDESLIKTSVEKFGAIGDFKLLAMHKNTMKYDKEKLIYQKNSLNQQINKYDIIIKNYEKEIEKFSYLISEEKKQKIKKMIKYDEEIASEYMQAKYIKNMKRNEFV